MTKDDSYIWPSNNPAVASVVDGVITAKSAGTAKITVYALPGVVTDSITVTVAEDVKPPVETEPEVPVPTEISLDNPHLALYMGTTGVLVPTVLDRNGDPIANAKIIWMSSNPMRAYVSTTGLVHGISGGSSNVTVTVEGTNLTATCLVYFLNSYLPPVNPDVPVDPPVVDGEDITIDRVISSSKTASMVCTGKAGVCFNNYGVAVIKNGKITTTESNGYSNYCCEGASAVDENVEITGGGIGVYYGGEVTFRSYFTHHCNRWCSGDYKRRYLRI